MWYGVLLSAVAILYGAIRLSRGGTVAPPRYPEAEGTELEGR